MEKEKQIYGIYEELKGILESMPKDTTWLDDDGFAMQVNKVIERTRSLCPEITDLDSYKIETDYLPQRGNTINAIPTKSKLNGLIGRIKGTYSFDNKNHSGGGHTFIQQQHQTQEQHQTVILDLQERIIRELPNYETGTKERGFLEKLKSSLPTLNNSMSILSAILSIATDSGLKIEDLRKLLGL